MLHPEPPFHEGLKTNRDANRLVDRVLVPNLRYVGTSESDCFLVTIRGSKSLSLSLRSPVALSRHHSDVAKLRAATG